MKINCLSCGFSFELDDETYSDYEGQVRCYACSALLEVKLEENRIKSLIFSKPTGRAAVEL
ncbi:MAG: zinc-ribbon domain-containing protein [Deltaproteobacteria bacterium]|nr:zinc-ribbon domain-containing protein [Deltaproteobacteria bacterium]